MTRPPVRGFPSKLRTDTAAFVEASLEEDQQLMEQSFELHQDVRNPKKSFWTVLRRAAEARGDLGDPTGDETGVSCVSSSKISSIMKQYQTSHERTEDGKQFLRVAAVPTFY